MRGGFLTRREGEALPFFFTGDLISAHMLCPYTTLERHIGQFRWKHEAKDRGVDDEEKDRGAGGCSLANINSGLLPVSVSRSLFLVLTHVPVTLGLVASRDITLLSTRSDFSVSPFTLCTVSEAFN